MYSITLSIRAQNKHCTRIEGVFDLSWISEAHIHEWATKLHIHVWLYDNYELRLGSSQNKLRQVIWALNHDFTRSHGKRRFFLGLCVFLHCKSQNVGKLSTYHRIYTLYMPHNKCQPFNILAKNLKTENVDHRVCECVRACVSTILWYILWCRNKKWIWMLRQVLVCRRGNQLGIKAASYQRISLIHTFNRLQQKAERLSCA